VLRLVAVCCIVMQCLRCVCNNICHFSVWQCVQWQCVAASLQRVAARCRVFAMKPVVAVFCSVLQGVAECCRVLHCVAGVCCRALQSVALCCSVSNYVAVCYSVLQCIAV